MTTIKSEPMQPSEMGGESKQSSSSSGTKGICNSMEELQQLFNKFKNFYLPQLESLYEDCTWLRGKLGLDDKKGKYNNFIAFPIYFCGKNILLLFWFTNL